jgi:methanogenic corrinoid protein MtbC1
MAEPLLIRFMQPLLAGRRSECFELIHAALQDTPAKDLLCDVIWPAVAQVHRLYCDDRVNTAVEHIAVRICRALTDQLQRELPTHPPTGRKAVVACAPGELEELGAQMCADLLQSQGWEICLVGGGVPHDELLALIGQQRPTVLLIFGTTPDEAPSTRALISLVREIGVCPTMNIVTSGGIFNRADGLWQEVGADASYPTARELLRGINDLPPREPRSVRKSIVKQRNRKRKSATPVDHSKAEALAATL